MWADSYFAKGFYPGTYFDPVITIVVTNPTPGMAVSSGGSGGSWYWISDFDRSTNKRKIRIRRKDLPPEIGETEFEQILREDDELLLLIMSLIENGVIE